MMEELIMEEVVRMKAEAYNAYLGNTYWFQPGSCMSCLLKWKHHGFLMSNGSLEWPSTVPLSLSSQWSHTVALWDNNCVYRLGKQDSETSCLKLLCHWMAEPGIRTQNFLTHVLTHGIRWFCGWVWSCIERNHHVTGQTVSQFMTRRENVIFSFSFFPLALSSSISASSLSPPLLFFQNE